MADYPVHDFDPRNIPADMLQAITCASFAEAIIDQALAGIMKTDVEVGSAIRAHMAMPLKFGILRSTAEIVVDNFDDLDELDEILEELQAALAKRNVYAHDQIGIAKAQIFAVSTKARAGLEVDINPVTPAQVEQEGIRIYNAGIALFQFIGLRGLFASSPPPRIPRQQKTKAVRKKRRHSSEG
jgi:hypothetical protein